MGGLLAVYEPLFDRELRAIRSRVQPAEGLRDAAPRLSSTARSAL
jgi:hypothetical protein